MDRHDGLAMSDAKALEAFKKLFDLEGELMVLLPEEGKAASNEARRDWIEDTRGLMIQSRCALVNGLDIPRAGSRADSGPLIQLRDGTASE